MIYVCLSVLVVACWVWLGYRRYVKRYNRALDELYAEHLELKRYRRETQELYGTAKHDSDAP